MVPFGQPMQWGSLMRSQAKMLGSSTSAAEKEVSAALRLVAASSWQHPPTLAAQRFCAAAVRSAVPSMEASGCTTSQAKHNSRSWLTCTMQLHPKC